MLLASSSSRASAQRALAQHRRTGVVAARARPLRLVATRATTEEQSSQSAPTLMRSGEETDNCDINVGGEYCSIDGKGKRVKDRSLGEMEAEFLEALSSYYYEGKPKLTDEEFALLKEELIWNGSKVSMRMRDGSASWWPSAGGRRSEEPGERRRQSRGDERRERCRRRDAPTPTSD